MRLWNVCQAITELLAKGLEAAGQNGARASADSRRTVDQIFPMYAQEVVEHDALGPLRKIQDSGVYVETICYAIGLDYG
jgi:hypothetical protein